MKNDTRRSAFTLIELLIVIAIIGLLASIVLVGLSGFRKSGRDVRRIADLKLVQTVLERYFNKCQRYPMSLDAPGTTCPDPLTSGQLLLWHNEFANELRDNNILSDEEMRQFPQDPLLRSLGFGGGDGDDASQSYQYRVDDSLPDQIGLRYVLRATLEEKDNAALQGDLDGSTVGNIDCEDGNGEGFYCLGFGS